MRLTSIEKVAMAVIVAAMLTLFLTLSYCTTGDPAATYNDSIFWARADSLEAIRQHRDSLQTQRRDSIKAAKKAEKHNRKSKSSTSKPKSTPKPYSRDYLNEPTE